MTTKNVRAIGFLLLLIFIISLYALYLLTQDKTPENYLFFGFTSLTFIIIYSISILNYKITGSSIGIEVEQARQEIMTSKKEIETLANTLIKLSYVIAGMDLADLAVLSKEHQDKIREYQNSIKTFLDQNIDEEVKKTISGLNEAIDLRIDKR